PDAKKAKDIVVDEGMIEGPIVPPGRYSVKITVGGQSATQPFTVVNDPRVTTSAMDLAAQYALALQIHDRLDTLVSALERVVQAELSARLDKEVAALRGIEMGDLAGFNRMLRDLNVPTVGVGADKR